MDRSDQGLKFEYTDASVAPSVTYYYKLEAMAMTGKSHFIAKTSATTVGVSSSDEPKKESQNKEEKEIGPSNSAETGAVKEDEKHEPAPISAVQDMVK
jgi:hypothetical protein